MKTWNKSDIGKILVYRKREELEGELEEKLERYAKDEVIAIYEINPRLLNTIGFIHYPIKLTSKFGILGLIRGQEKESKEDIKEEGDWAYIGETSREEKEVLYKIAKYKKVFLD
jgi:hypothetical protein